MNLQITNPQSSFSHVSEKYKDMLPPDKGHIPTAVHIHWNETLNADGTYKPADELVTLFKQKISVNIRAKKLYQRETIVPENLL